MPWLIAGFLAMLWLVPFDAVDLPVQLPIDAKLDRIVLVAIAWFWFLMILASPRRRGGARPSLAALTIVGFLAVAVASVASNLETLSILGETDLATKKLALLASYALFFLIVATSIRVSELRSFTTLFIVLATAAAIGTVWEYRTGFNVFYEWFDALTPGFFSVGSPPPDSEWRGANNTGPTGHALAIATMLAIALPFAVVRLLEASEPREKLIYGGVTALLIAGNMATVRKTGAVVPAVALLTLLAFRPRAMLRILPIGLLIFVFVNVIAPGAMVSIKAQLVSSNFSQSGSTLARRGRLPRRETGHSPQHRPWPWLRHIRPPRLSLLGQPDSDAENRNGGPGRDGLSADDRRGRRIRLPGDSVTRPRSGPAGPGRGGRGGGIRRRQPPL